MKSLEKKLRVLTECAGVVGILGFIAANWFGWFMPATWVVPIAWTSSIALVVAALLWSGLYSYENDSEALIGSAMMTISGGVITLIGLIVIWAGGFNEKLLSIYTHPSMGVMSMGMALLGVFIIIETIRELCIKISWRSVYTLFGGLLILSLGVLVSNCWIVPLGALGQAIFGYMLICCLAMMIFLLVMAVVTGNLRKL